MMNKTTNHNITHYINIVYYYINVLNIYLVVAVICTN